MLVSALATKVFNRHSILIGMISQRMAVEFSLPSTSCKITGTCETFVGQTTQFLILSGQMNSKKLLLSIHPLQSLIWRVVGKAMEYMATAYFANFSRAMVAFTELTSQQTKSVPWAAPIYQTIAANTTLSHLNLNNNRLKMTMMQALLQKP